MSGTGIGTKKEYFCKHHFNGNKVQVCIMVMKAPAIIFFFLLYTTLTGAQPYSPQSVPNTRLINGSYVSNPDGILSSSSVSQINQILSGLESKTTVQVAVVVLRSIGEADHIEFAQQLFDLWKIGRAKKDNGLLVLMVEDQHQIRFQTGLGLEGVLPDVFCKRIQMEEMIPLFKGGKYDEGMIAGIQAVANILNDPAFADELRDDIQKDNEGWLWFFWIVLVIGLITATLWYFIADAEGGYADSKQKDSTIQYPRMQLTRLQWIVEFAAIPVALLILFNFVRVPGHILYFLVALYAYALITLFHKRLRMKPVIDDLFASGDYYRVVEFLQEYQTFWLVMGILFPFPMLIHYSLYLRRIRHFRSYPRTCRGCGKELHKLNEKADDEYLQKGQVFEEKLGSVDYDVWKCSSCGNTQIFNYIKRNSRYDPCPACGTRAFYLASTRTIDAPSYSHTGTGERVSRCKFCKHTKVEKYTIAKLTASSSSSSSTSSSSSSGGSSSESSGGSWGGGSSGGGGASSSW